MYVMCYRHCCRWEENPEYLLRGGGGRSQFQREQIEGILQRSLFVVRLSTYLAENVEETCQVINHALNTGAEILGLLTIDATGNFFIATSAIRAH